MSSREHVKDIEPKVESLLRKYPQLKDDDKMLYLAYLCVNHGLMQTMCSKCYALLKDKMKHSPPPSSVVRARRELQKNVVELRGKRYADRHFMADTYKGGT